MSIYPVCIQASRLHVLDVHLVVPCCLLLHRHQTFSRCSEVYLHAVGKGSPADETTLAICAVCRTDGDFRVGSDGMYTHLFYRWVSHLLAPSHSSNIAADSALSSR